MLPGAAIARQPIRLRWLIVSAAYGEDQAATPALGSVFVGRDRFHQGHELPLDGLILDLAVGAQEPQAEGTIEKQQAFHFASLAVAVVEEGDGHIERRCNLLKTGGAHAIDAFLVFLNLLETYAQLFAKLGLRDLLFHAPQPDSFAKLNIWLAGTALLHLLGYRFIHTVSTVLRLDR